MKINELNWKRVFLVVFLGVILITIGIFGISYLNQKNNLEEQNLESIKYQIEEQTGQDITIKNVKTPDPNIKNPLTTTNPRHSFQNSTGDEVAYIDHEGKIGGIGNVTFTTSGSGFGFFNYIGSSVTKVIKGFFTNLQVDYGVNASNYTGIEYCNATDCYTVADFILDTDTDTNTYNTTEQMQDAVGGGFGEGLQYDDAGNSYNFDCSEATDQAGDHLSCSTENIIVDDDFVLNSGDTITGNLNLSGANVTWGGTGNITSNVTCIKIFGSTSILEIC